MTADVIIKPQHLQAAGLCVRGARQWFALHNLDFAHFIRHGYPCSQIEALNDALGNKVAAVAREEAEEQ